MSTRLLLALALLAPSSSALAAGPEEVRGIWAASVADCFTPLRVVIAGTGDTLAVDIPFSASGPPTHLEATFATPATDVEIPGQGFIRLTPRDGQLVVNVGRLVDGQAQLSPDRVQVRCPSDAPLGEKVQGQRDAQALGQALARFQKTLGPSWLVGSWGLVDDGEDKFMVAGELPGSPLTGTLASGACPRLLAAWYQKFPAKKGAFDRRPPPPGATRKAPDGTLIAPTAYLTFAVAPAAGRPAKPASGGPADALWVVPQHRSRSEFLEPLPVELAKAPRGAPKGAFAVVIDGVRYTVSVRGTQHFHAGPDGALVTELDAMPFAVDPSWYLLSFHAETPVDGRTDFLVARCD